MVHITSLLLATAAVFGSVSAAPTAEPNSFEGKDRHVGSYGKKLEKTITAFEANNDTLNAARTRTVQQKISTFTAIDNLSISQESPHFIVLMLVFLRASDRLLVRTEFFNPRFKANYKAVNLAY
ncbi:hypothetical protein EJ07DRAFT_179896 [Lizonia empirigonia]|nr:hypothetical protein EJ07DRAFT_179896 [Lizonia empirigonia]